LEQNPQSEVVKEVNANPSTVTENQADLVIAEKIKVLAQELKDPQTKSEVLSSLDKTMEEKGLRTQSEQKSIKARKRVSQETKDPMSELKTQEPEEELIENQEKDQERKKQEEEQIVEIDPSAESERIKGPISGLEIALEKARLKQEAKKQRYIEEHLQEERSSEEIEQKTEDEVKSDTKKVTGEDIFQETIVIQEQESELSKKIGQKDFSIPVWNAKIKEIESVNLSEGKNQIQKAVQEAAPVRARRVVTTRKAQDEEVRRVLGTLPEEK